MPAHVIDHEDGTLNILDPSGWQKLPTQDLYQWKPFGYRLYDEIEVCKVWMLWLDEMLPLFQMINTGLRHPGLCRVVLPSPREVQRTGSIWKTYPCPDKIANQMRWAGFQVTTDRGLLLGCKG